MSRLPARDETYFTTVRGRCGGCGEVGPARVVLRGGEAFQQSLCVHCRPAPVRIAGDADWYLRAVLQPQADSSPLPGATPPRRGCPDDCGPCTWHGSPCRTPVIPLDGDGAAGPSVEAMARRVAQVAAVAGTVDQLTVTGGDALPRARLVELLRGCLQPGIHRTVLVTSVARCAAEPTLGAELAALGTAVHLRVEAADGAALPRVLAGLAASGVRLGLVAALDGEGTAAAARLDAAFALLRVEPAIESLCGETSSLPVDVGVRLVSARSGGALAGGDFAARPPAHPLCRQVACWRRPGGSACTIAVHAPMDLGTFDAARAMMCPDLVPAAPDRLVPACMHGGGR